MGFFGILFLSFLAVFILLGLLGFWMQKRRAGKAPSAEEDEALSEETVDNIQNLNDRFNRARYMDEDKAP